MSQGPCWSQPRRSKSLGARRLLSGLLFLDVVLSIGMAYADNARRLVEFVPGTPPALQQEIVAASGSKLWKFLPLVNAVAIKLPEANITTALDYLQSHPEVEQVYLDPKVTVKKTSGALSESETVEEITPHNWKPGPDYPWNLSALALPKVQAKNPTVQGQGVEVAVVDTGIDPTHPALAGVVIGGYNAVTSTGSATATSGEGGDGEGGDGEGGDGEGGDGEGGDAHRANYVDCHGHGTHIAGTIASSTVGIAPRAKLHAVRVLDCHGGGSISDLISGLNWIYERPQIRVVNLSLGFYKESPYPLLEQAIKTLHEAGVVLISAAGNYRADCLHDDNGRRHFAINPLGCNTRVKFPARYPETIAVAANEADKSIAAYSIRGPEVALTAPGGSQATPVISTSVWSSTPQDGASGEGGDGRGAYGGGSGTSMAAAHVTGIVALMLSVRPTLQPAEVRAILQNSASASVGLPASSQGRGRVSAHGAVSMAKSWTGLPASSLQRIVKSRTSIDPTAQLDNAITVEEDSVVRANARLMRSAKLQHSSKMGRKATLGEYAVLEESASIGTNVAVGHRAVLKKASRVGNDAEDIFGTTLGDYTILKENVVVGSNVRIGDYTVVEENTRIGDRSTIDDHTLIKKRVVVGNDVTIGSNVVLHEDVVVCDGAVIPPNATIASRRRVGTCS